MFSKNIIPNYLQWLCSVFSWLCRTVVSCAVGTLLLWVHLYWPAHRRFLVFFKEQKVQYLFSISDLLECVIIKKHTFLDQNVFCGYSTESVLLSIQNKFLNWWIRKYSHFYAQNFCSPGSMTYEPVHEILISHLRDIHSLNICMHSY